MGKKRANLENNSGKQNPESENRKMSKYERVNK